MAVRNFHNKFGLTFVCAPRCADAFTYPAIPAPISPARGAARTRSSAPSSAMHNSSRRNIDEVFIYSSYSRKRLIFTPLLIGLILVSLEDGFVQPLGGMNVHTSKKIHCDKSFTSSMLKPDILLTTIHLKFRVAEKIVWEEGDETGKMQNSEPEVQKTRS